MAVILEVPLCHQRHGKGGGWALSNIVTHSKMVLARRYQGVFFTSLRKGGR